MARPKWQYLYYALAAFDLFAISTSLYLNHEIANIYGASVQVNQAWSLRLKEYSELGKLAGLVNAPGNDVFDSHQVAVESKRLQTSLSQFQKRLNAARQELKTNVDGTQAAPILADLDAVDTAMAAMIAEANLIFSYFQKQQPEMAGRRMATMDRKYGQVNIALADLRLNVSRTQQQILEQQKKDAEDLKKYEYGITVAIVLMIAGVTLYGHKLAQQVASDTKAREQAIADLQQTETRLTERTQELEQTLSELRAAQNQLVESEKMAALGHLVAGIAHEINTPLGAIGASIGNITTALDQSLQSLPALIHQLTPPQLSAFFELVQIAQNSQPLTSSREERQLRKKLQEYLETEGIENSTTFATFLSQMGISPPLAMAMPILKMPDGVSILERVFDFAIAHNNSRNIQLAVDRASKIVFALKSYAHQDPNSQCIQAAVVDGLETVLVLYQNQIKRGIDVLKNYQPVPMIFCYPDELTQVWSNLISNAIQAMNYHGKLEISVCQQQQHVVVQITDEGTGIPTEIQSRIFDPFFTTKAAGEGSGLGLNIVYKIVKKHQGKIELNSEPGHTMFQVWLPIITDRPVPS